jgi:hypothetical protein
MNIYALELMGPAFSRLVGRSPRYTNKTNSTRHVVVTPGRLPIVNTSSLEGKEVDPGALIVHAHPEELGSRAADHVSWSPSSHVPFSKIKTNRLPAVSFFPFIKKEKKAGN